MHPEMNFRDRAYDDELPETRAELELLLFLLLFRRKHLDNALSSSYLSFFSQGKGGNRMRGRKGINETKKRIKGV